MQRSSNRSSTMLLHLAVGLLVVSCQLALHVEAGKKVFCYYSSFAQNRQGIGKFLPEDIDPFLCTHIIFAFVDIHQSGTELMAFNPNDLDHGGLYQRAIQLKEKNPALKVLLAVGGWQIGSKPFLPMISDEGNMRMWIKNVVSYLRKYNFDGFDMDWEFPATRGSSPEDKYRYTKLMKGLYEEFAREAEETGREKLILTMATAAGTYFIDRSYEPRKLIGYMDYMLLMTYNYHGQWEKRTGHHTGLWRHRNDPPGEQSELHVEWSIDYWLSQGVPKEKLIVGLATYGMSYTLANPEVHGVHAPATGGGRMGPYTKETGILSYYEICQNIQHNGWRTAWNEDQGVPYAYGGDQWVGFDNIDSMKMKAELIMKRDVAGAFVWSVEMDDFSGVCGDGKYPLLSTVVRILKPYEGVVQLAQAESKLRVSTDKEVSTVMITDSPKSPNTDSTTTRKTESHTSQMPEFATKTDSTIGNLFSSQSPSHANSRMATQWAKPTWRSRDIATEAPWWKRSSSDDAPVTHLNARPTGKPIEEESPETTTAPKRSPWENSVHDKSEGQRTWKQESSAGAQNKGGNTINCGLLGSGLFPHPTECDKFVMCLPGAWMDYPPHIMSCPAGTKYDKAIKVCNHASEVDCSD